MFNVGERATSRTRGNCRRRLKISIVFVGLLLAAPLAFATSAEEALSPVIANGAVCELGIEHAQFSIARRPLRMDSLVTSIYRRESGALRTVDHHGDKPPGVSDVLRRAGKMQDDMSLGMRRSIRGSSSR